MGLDITAYSKGRLLPKHERDDACYDEHAFVFAYACFPRSYRGLADADQRHSFSGSGSDFIGGRCYDVSDSESHAFCAGSYSGYNQFRDTLAKAMLGVEAHAVFIASEQYVDAPFYELINFADNEGAIGPDAAADLLKDFEDDRARFSDYWAEVVAVDPSWAGSPTYYLNKYEDWAYACRLAADNGFISFH